MKNLKKARGIDIRDFFDNGWPEGYYVDDYELSVYGDDGVTLTLDPNAQYELNKFGYLFEEGGADDVGITFTRAFNRWYEAKTTTTILIQVSKENELAVREQLKALGLTIL